MKASLLRITFLVNLFILVLGSNQHLFSQCSIPPPPLLSPVSNLNCLGVTLNFNTGGGSTTALVVQYDDNPSFSSPTQQVVGPEVTSLSITASAPGTIIYWRIRAVDCTGACNCYSAYVTGTAVTIPSCPATADDCANAIPLSFQANGSGAWTCSTTTGATASVEANPSCWTSNTLEDVWYKVTITGSNLLVTTDQSLGTSVDTQLAIYASCGGTPQACSMDAYLDYYGYYETTTGATTVATGLTSGNTYYVRLDGDAALDGYFCVKATGVASNDCYTNAVTLTSGNTISGTTYGAREDCDGAGTVDCDNQGNVISCGSGGSASIENNVWYIFNCPATGPYELVTTSVQCNGANGLQIWSALHQNACSDYTLQVQDNSSGESCNNTAAIQTTMINQFTCVAGEVVRITVDGFAAEMCSYDLVINPMTTIPPVAVNDNLTIAEDVIGSISVSANDSDADGTLDLNKIDLDLVIGGIQNSFVTSEGNWSVNSSGTLQFIPNLNYNGTASISYVIYDDDNLVSNTATVTIVVTPVPDAPVAVNDNASTNMNTAISFSITGNDTDPENDLDVSKIDLDVNTAGVQNFLNTTDGNWTVNASGVVTFTPTTNFTGTTSIAYVIYDLTGLSSNQALIAVTVNSCFSDPNADCDVDGLSNNTETTLGTNPSNPDSDGDGLSDGEEQSGVDQGITTAVPTGTSDPLDPCDPFGVTANLNFSGTVGICAGQSITLSTSSSGTYQWSDGSAGASITINAAGTYSLTVTNGVCQATSASVIVNILPSPNVSAGSDVNLCAGNFISLNASSTSSVSYAWSNGMSGATISVSPAVSTNYTVTATDLSNGCMASDQVLVNVLSLPVISLTGSSNPSTCGNNNGNIAVTGTGSGTLFWNGNVSGSMTVTSWPATISGLPSGVYSIGYTATCTSDYLSVTLTDPGVATPTISLSGPAAFCQGGSVVLSSSASNGNMWNTGSSSTSITVTTSGVYAVTYTVGSCSATSAAVSITVLPNPNINAGAISNPSSCGNNNGSIEITGSGTGLLSWSGASSGSQSGVTLPYLLTGLIAGNYSFSFNNGCASNSLVVALSNPGINSPTISLSGPTTFCQGGSVTLTSSETSGNTWSTGATTNSITVTQSGTYTVTFFNGSCTAISAAILVDVITPPNIANGNLTNPTVCGATDGSIEVTGSGTGTLNWSGTASGSMSNITLPATISGLSSGNYTITFDNGCNSNVLVITLTNPVLPNPVINVSGNLSFCQGGSVTLSSASGTMLAWSTGANATSIVVNSSGIYTATNNLNGCSATSAPITVTVFSNPVVSITPFDTICSTDAPFTFTQGSPSGGIYQINGTTLTDFDPAIFPGSSLILYSYTDANGCSGSAATNIFVDNCAGIDDLTAAVFKVYPNPGNGHYILEGPEQEYALAVCDFTGRILFEIKAFSKTELNLSDYGNGVYFLMLNGNTSKTIPLIKQ